MTDPLPDIWHSRDLPVLRAAVAHVDQYPTTPKPISELAIELNMEADLLSRSLIALERDGLVRVAWANRMGGKAPMRLAGVSAEAYRVAGAWPSPETGATRLLSALQHIAENGTEDERTRAQKLLDGFAGAGRQVAVSVASAVITGQLT